MGNVDLAVRRSDVGALAFRVLRSTPVDARRTVVLVHGIGTSHRYFLRLHQLLAEHHDVISVDLPGFGGLPKPGRDVDIAEMAGALGAVLDEQGVGEAVLVGHSMGAQWVTELALRRPDLASHVVLLGPVTDDHHRTAFAQARALGLDALGEPPSALWKVFGDYARCGPRWFFTQLRHMLTYPTEEGVRMLQPPLLVIRGASDPVAGLDWTRRLRDAAPAGALVIVPGSNHVVQHRAPRAVASAIDAFVAAGASIGRESV